ncbi:aminotransferase class IV [Paenibacillus thermotolerans]|uniref:aminotransferase class IV n=1 Tax=Paenibacillus thermotolerans TaxID=3027807 RepID=UPI002368454B|nr:MULTISPECIES: aminotransferase class IV [unclassified Paenibacillus]
MRVVNLNGSLVNERRAAISIYDHGILYGCAFYTTMRICKGHIFLIDDHLQKINYALNDLGILHAHGIDWESEIHRAIRANGMNSGVARLNITAGNVGWRMPRAPYSKPNFFIFTRNMASPTRMIPKSIIVLKTPYERPNVHYKSVNRTNGVKARRELWGKRFYDGLFITAKGVVAEGIDTNIFMVYKGEIITPDISTGILPGLTRRYVMELAKSLGFPVREEIFTLEQLRKADEIFITNTGAGITPIHNIHNLLTRSEFPIARTLWEQYVKQLEYLRSAGEINNE